MIQEIYNSLWIKSYLLNMNVNNEIEELKKMSDEDRFKNYNRFITEVKKLVEEDYFLLLDESLIPKVHNYIGAFRFDYKNPETVENINSILGFINEYKLMNELVKTRCINEYLIRENTFRNLPIAVLKGRWALEIKYCIAHDLSNFKKIFLGVDNTTYNENEKRVVDADVFSTVSTINYILWNYPQFIEDEEVEARIKNLLDFDIESLQNPMDSIEKYWSKKALKYIKGTLKEIKIVKKYNKKQKLKEKHKGLEFIQS